MQNAVSAKAGTDPLGAVITGASGGLPAGSLCLHQGTLCWTVSHIHRPKLNSHLKQGPYFIPHFSLILHVPSAVRAERPSVFYSPSPLLFIRIPVHPFGS